ncbi:unnamed protein product [Rotaria sp. Silwood2]|nr:unnamed protein product [Rotaria sp. Silwood2]
MSTTRDGRYSAGGLQHRKTLPPSLSRPTSSQIANNNNSLKTKQTFLEYKHENRITKDQLQPQAVLISNRSERRKSKVNNDYSARKFDESAATLVQVQVNHDTSNQDNSLPLKIFNGTKKAITDSGSTPEDLEERGLIQKIEESIKQLRNADALLADKNVNTTVLTNLCASTNQLISNIQLLQQNVNDIAVHLKKPVGSKDAIDTIRKALRALPKEAKSQLKIRQEWDMKKLYAEVFKVSYMRNELRTSAQKVDKATSADASKDEVNYYTVHTTACDIDKSLLDDIRAKVQECSASQLSVLLARYMLELGEYRAVRKYLTGLCSESTGILKDDPTLPSIYNCLGMTFSRQRLYADAIEYYKKALDCQARIGYSNNNALAEIYNNIGLSYIGLKLMNEAQAMFEEAERIQLREPLTTRLYLASIYGNIAYVHYAKNGAEQNLEESENYFEKAIRMYQKSTSKITHDAIERELLKAECYSNYGHLLSVKKAADAQERYNEALKMYKNNLPEGDPKLMRAYMNIMMEHAHHRAYEKVIELYEDTTFNGLIKKQAENLFALDKMVTLEDLIILIQIVGACYIQYTQRFFKAMSIWIRAYELERKAKLVQLLSSTETPTLQWSRKLIDIAYNKSYTYFMSEQVQMPTNDEALLKQERILSGRAKR